MSPMYFVAAEGGGFTTMEEQAKTTPKGFKIVAPGVTQYISKTYMDRGGQLWELLLDQMEARYELIEAEERTFIADERIDAFTEVLAMLTYGVVEESSKNLITKQAEIRYMQAVAE